MKNKKWIILTTFILFCILILAGCDGFDAENITSGSVSKNSQNCSMKMKTGNCEGSIENLSGTYEIEVSTNSQDKVGIELDVQITDGQMLVWFINIDGDKISAEVSPGSPTTLVGIVETESEFDEGEFFTFTFEALSDQVDNITYTIIHKDLD
ncbi:MAG: hypothetical protein JEZ06_15375 [Anaerolineaceae bacterium]|nr:hypothetical protein [Anaerolineaceae bacterium]